MSYLVYYWHPLNTSNMHYMYHQNHPLNNTPRDGVALAHSCQRWTWKWKRKYGVLTLRKKWDIEQNSLFSNTSTFPAVLRVGRRLASCWGPLANYPRPKTNNYTPWSTQATWLPTLWCPVGGNKGVSLTQVFVYSHDGMVLNEHTL